MKRESETLYLVEHFFSIQGEGRYSGTPSIFLRFGGCNLRCPGFGCHEADGKRIYGCDTVRAVYSSLYGRSWHRVADLSELEEVILGYEDRLTYRPDIVITGGEPMIYTDHPVFRGLLERLAAGGYRVTVETNATIAPSLERDPFYSEITFAMAVKLSGSGEPECKRVVPEAIEILATKTKESFFKFTLDRGLAREGAADQIARICSGYDNEVYCMPLGSCESELRLNATAVAEFCLKHGYRYSDRLHVRLWNREERR
ncbi:queuosine biosynthesis QueE Radical SAM [Hydrogenimonas sp.]|nr:queuosine biosynthesis QueE Radical SAM [Hydrogenimonas sp.]